MSLEMIEFLKDLSVLLEKYKAGLSYTIDDDGVHVSLESCPRQSVCIGWPTDGDVSEIRQIIKSNTLQHQIQ